MNEIEVTPDTPRSRRVVTASLVVVFALVLGVVAVLAGRGGSGGAAHAALVPLPAGGQSGVGSSQNATAQAVIGAGGVTDQYALMGPGSFQLEGALPALAGHAPAYRVDRPVTEAQVLKLAQALGLTKPVTAEPMGWSVTDGTHRLDVTKGNGGQWYYTAAAGTDCVGIAAVRGGKGGIVCGGYIGPNPAAGVGGQGTAGSGPATPISGSEQATAASGQTSTGQPSTGFGQAGGSRLAIPPTGGDSTGSAATTEPSVPSVRGSGVPPTQPAIKIAPTTPTTPSGTPLPPATCYPPPCPNGAMCAAVCLPGPPPAANLLSQQDALKRARDVLGRAGIDLAGADVKVSASPYADVVTVNPAVAGLPTVGVTTTLTLGAKGAIQFGQGVLGGLTLLGDYPLAGTKAGFQRLQAGKWLFGALVPQLGIARGAGSTVTTSGSKGPSGAPMPAIGAPQPLTRVPVKVTGVHLALARVFGGDGSSYLEPAYLFETANQWSLPPVSAVTDALLQIAPAPRPIPLPAPAPAPAPAQKMPSVTPATAPATAATAGGGG